MLDRYWYGHTARISPEAPVPVVQVQETEERAGGAGNVALNTAALGCKTVLFGICGNDPAGERLEELFISPLIDCHLQKIPDIPTITKLRVLSLHQQLIRLDFENAGYSYDVAPLLEGFQQALTYANAVILSDYAKGTLHSVQLLIQAASAAGVPVLIDPKGQDFERYRGATVLTPNRREFEAVVGPCQDENELVEKGLALLQMYGIEALLITRGEQGMTLIREKDAPLHLPVCCHEVYDVTGAGDTVIAVLAAGLAVNTALPIATRLANLAASISVSKLGAATVSPSELQQLLLTEHGTTQRGVLSEEQLLIAIEEAKAQGERIVMTGGCFDILHAGHVRYLEEAKCLGDRLVVVVNEDDSVRRLKGSTRPINSVAQRMAVLAGLQAVDWVVSFSENTPERMIGQLQPDLWVKAGDYQIDDLPEKKVVESYGGEIKILSFMPGCSTSGIVERIRKRQGEMA